MCMCVCFTYYLCILYCWASLVAETIKNPPAVLETWVWSLGQDNLLEKGMATHSSILAWKFPWTEEPGRPQSMGSEGVTHDWAADISHTLYCEDFRAGFFCSMLLSLTHTQAFPTVQRVKNPPAGQETQVRSLGQENPLEKEMPTNTNILAWSIPWTGPGGRATVCGVTEFDTTEWVCVHAHACTHTHTHTQSSTSVFLLVQNNSVSLIGWRRIPWVGGITVFPQMFVL